MKTIEEAAYEHSEPKANELSHCNMEDLTILDLESNFSASFKAGVEFAQRFIPVEEELPEKLVQVIVKLENGWHTTTWIMEDGSFAFNVKPTHWRHIELK